MVNEQGVSGEFKGSQRSWVEVDTEVGDKAKQVDRAHSLALQKSLTSSESDGQPVHFQGQEGILTRVTLKIKI